MHGTVFLCKRQHSFSRLLFSSFAGPALLCESRLVLRFCLIIALILGSLARAVAAETFQLANGESLSGELLLTTANDQGIQIKVAEGNYQRVAWTNFTQGDLKKFQANPKLAPLVEAYVEITPEERIRKTDVGELKQPPKLSRPSGQSFFGAVFGSGLGWFLMVILYGAVIYAGYEVAIFRAQPVPLVAGLSAIPFIGILAPIIFLSMPTRMPAVEEGAQEGAESLQPVPAADTPEAVNPMQDASVHHPTALHLAASAPHGGTAASQPGQAHQAAKSSIPPTTTFQRGQFTFNRRFFETKFPGFFGVVRRDTDKEMLLIIKSTRGEYHGERISRIAANDLHLEIRKGDATSEVMIPFQEIKEIQLKHRDAP
jgi:hypothetical protein